MRIRFANVAGLDALECQLHELRAVHFTSSAPQATPDLAARGTYRQEGARVDFTVKLPRNEVPEIKSLPFPASDLTARIEALPRYDIKESRGLKFDTECYIGLVKDGDYILRQAAADLVRKAGVGQQPIGEVLTNASYGHLIKWYDGFNPGKGTKLYTAQQPAAVVPDGWQQVLDEVTRATRKFPTWPTDPLHAVAVLGEEFGELTKAVLQTTYEPHKVEDGELQMEAVQTAAMALRFVASLGSYEFTRCAQHSQKGDK